MSHSISTLLTRNLHEVFGEEVGYCVLGQVLRVLAWCGDITPPDSALT